MDVWVSLKADGILIYSTCTFNPGENEENIAWLATQTDFESVTIPVDNSWGIEEIELLGIKGYRFAYHKTKGEGFFVSVIRKKGEAENTSNKSKKQSLGSPIPKNLVERVKKLVIKGNQFVLNETVFNTTTNLGNIASLLGSLNIVRPGCKIATIVRDELKPNHSLALSTSFNYHNFERVGFNNEQINLFLRRENFQNPSLEKGLYNATWKGLSVGFINHLGIE